MKYDFNTASSRRHTDSVKWDVKDNELPLSIADMDIETAPEIKKAILKRTESGIYGYTEPMDDWYQAYISFFSDRYNVKLEKEWMMFSTGVVPTISSSVRKLTKEGDNVVVLSPVYNIFYNSIVNNNRKVLEVELIHDGDDYKIDFESLEKAFALENTSLIIFCNPANPVGRIWTKEELAKLGELAYRHSVIVLSDEIHGFITRPGKKYIPFFSINETNKMNSVNCVSVTKPFNLAGIQTSLCFVPNPELYKKVNRQINTDEVAEPNIFACPVTVAALNEGREWLDQANAFFYENEDEVRLFIKNNIPLLSVTPSDATYLLWIDVRKIAENSKDFVTHLRETTGLILADGAVYGKGGNGFVRMNVACPKAILNDALSRLKTGVESYLTLKK